jgi:hypothetical protein
MATLPFRIIIPQTGHWHSTRAARPTRFVGFKVFPIWLMMRKWTGSAEPCEETTMHDLLIAMAFIGMVIAPAIVAAKSGAESADEMED